MTSVRYEKNDFVSYALYNIAANSNEDRSVTCMSHERDGMDGLASFGVFDGHMGAAAAEACASQLHSMVAVNVQSLVDAAVNKPQINSDSVRDEHPLQPFKSPPQSTTGDPPPSDLDQSKKQNDHLVPPVLVASDVRDAIVCESIGRACSELDREIRRHTNAGSTVVSLFLLWEGEEEEEGEGDEEGGDPYKVASLTRGLVDKTNKRVRAYCANMGDSRCVLLRSYETKEVLNMPSNFDPNHRVVEAGKRENNNTVGKTVEGLDAAVAEASSSRCVAVHMMTEDHKLQLNRERRRIVSLSAPVWYTLPCDASPIFMPSYARTAPPVGCSPLPPVELAPRFTASSNNLAIVNGLPPIKTPPASPEWSSHGADPGSGGGLFGSANNDLSSSSSSSFPVTSSGTHSLHGASMHGGGRSLFNRRAGSIHGSVGVSEHDLTSNFVRRYAVAGRENDDDVGTMGFIFDWGYPPAQVLSAVGAYMQTVGEGVPSARCAPGAADPKYAYSLPLIAEAATATAASAAAVAATAAAEAAAAAAAEAEAEAAAVLPNENEPTSENKKNALFNLPSTSRSGKVRAKTITEQLKDPSYVPPVVYRKSFIQQRRSADGRTAGSEAFFGRHKISIMMSRSIGDRFGPRSCVSVPEISAYSVPANGHARFVLGSDGFWDVVTIEDVRCVGMIRSNQDPRMLASQLAQEAHRRRERARMRMDDITVLVVDVNPNSFVGVNGTSGSDTVLTRVTARLRERFGDDRKCIIA